MDRPNYYELLDVSRDATPEAIRSSYRHLMQRLRIHPDLGGDTATAALINKAYAVLSDAERRSDYDARLVILERVARGFINEPGARDAAEENSRVLDPARECLFCEAPHECAANNDHASCRSCGSPLNAAENLRIEPADKRAVARIPKRLQITFFTHWPQPRGFPGRTEDVSLSGLRLVTKQHVRQGQRIKLVSRLIEAVGDITHCAPRKARWRSEHVAGVSFLTLRFVRSVGGFLSRRV